MSLTLARDEQVQVSVFQIEPLAEVKIRQRPPEKIDTVAQVNSVPE